MKEKELLEGQDSLPKYPSINVNEFDFENVFYYIEKNKLKHLKFILIQFDFRFFFNSGKVKKWNY
jgi:hypothetical protein